MSNVFHVLAGSAGPDAMEARKTPAPTQMQFWQTQGGNFRAYKSEATMADRIDAGFYRYDKQRSGMSYFPVEMSNTVICDLSATQADIRAEVSLFWQARPEYMKRQIKHRRGFLLHGVPGCGKTTIIRQMVYDIMELDGVALELCDLDDLDQAIADIRLLDGWRPIMLVIEDLDRWDGYDSTLTNTLDGMSSLDGVVVVATTNHLNRVPDRLKKRPGRFDSCKQISLPDPDCRRKAIKTITGLEDGDTLLEQIVSDTEENTMAEITEQIVQADIFDKMR